jgi:WD40 repeat protein
MQKLGLFSLFILFIFFTPQSRADSKFNLPDSLMQLADGPLLHGVETVVWPKSPDVLFLTRDGRDGKLATTLVNVKSGFSMAVRGDEPGLFDTRSAYYRDWSGTEIYYRFVDIETGQSTRASIACSDLDVNPAGNSYIENSFNPKLNYSTRKVVDLETNQKVETEAFGLKYSEDGKFIINSSDRQLELWDPRTAKVIKNFPPKEIKYYGRSLLYLADQHLFLVNTCLASECRKSTLDVYSTETLEPVIMGIPASIPLFLWPYYLRSLASQGKVILYLVDTPNRKWAIELNLNTKTVTWLNELSADGIYFVGFDTATKEIVVRNQMTGASARLPGMMKVGETEWWRQLRIIGPGIVALEPIKYGDPYVIYRFEDQKTIPLKDAQNSLFAEKYYSVLGQKILFYKKEGDNKTLYSVELDTGLVKNWGHMDIFTDPEWKRAALVDVKGKSFHIVSLKSN